MLVYTTIRNRATVPVYVVRTMPATCQCEEVQPRAKSCECMRRDAARVLSTKALIVYLPDVQEDHRRRQLQIVVSCRPAAR